MSKIRIEEQDQPDEDDGAIRALVPADNDLWERLAATEHDRWARWMTHLFSTGTHNPDGTWTMPAWAVARWQRQVRTPYANLAEAEKDSDRAEADQTLQVLERGPGVGPSATSGRNTGCR